MAYKPLFSGTSVPEETPKEEVKETTKTTKYKPLFAIPEEPVVEEEVKEEYKTPETPLVYSPEYKAEIEEKLAKQGSIFDNLKTTKTTISAPKGTEISKGEEGYEEIKKEVQKRETIQRIAEKLPSVEYTPKEALKDIKDISVVTGGQLRMQAVDVARMVGETLYNRAISPVTSTGINPIPLIWSAIDKNTYDQFAKSGEETISNWANEQKQNIAQDIQPAYEKIYDEKEGLSNPKEYAVTITSGTISILEAIGITLITKNPSLAAAILSTQEAAGIYSESRDAGKSVEQSELTATIAGVATYFLEKFGLEYIFKPKVGKGVGSMVSNIFKTGAVETGQEELQTVVQNLTSIIGYDKAVNWGDDIWQTAVGTFLPSALLGGGTNVVVTNKYISYLEKTYGLSEKEATEIANGMEKTVFDIAKKTPVTGLEKGLAEKPIITTPEGKPLAVGQIQAQEEEVIDISTPAKMEEAISKAEETPVKEITPVERLISKVKEKVPEIERAEVKKEVVEAPKVEIGEVSVEGKDIPALEKDLSTQYKSVENAEEQLYQLYTELELSEAGERFMTEEGNFIGKTSTFPEWIPSNLRSKKLFDSVLGGLYDINNIKYPDKNKTAQRELYDFILDEFDSRLGIDTSKIRNKILEQYEPTKKEKAKKPTREGVKRRRKVAEPKQKTITGEEVKPEERPAKQKGLGLKPEKEVMAKKIKPAITSEEYIAAKEEEIKKKAEGVEELPMFQELAPALPSKIETMEDAQYANILAPKNLTIKLFNLPVLKGRETAGYVELKNYIKNAPLKKPEKDLIEATLETEQFKDVKRINLEDFKNAILSELMPLKIIPSNTYATYGSEAVNMDFDEEYNQMTYIFNSPFEHGVVGHFRGDFDTLLEQDDVEIKKIPTTEKWAVIRKGVELTQENVEENVYTVTNTKKQAEEWFKRHTLLSGKIKTEKVGLFGHVRTFDEIKENISNVAEIQSDSFQGGRVRSVEQEVRDNEKYIEEHRTYIEEVKKDIETAEDSIKYLKEKNNSEYNEEIIRLRNVIRARKEIISERENRINDLLLENKNLIETKDISREKFFQFKNIWHERMIKEIIRLKASEGFKIMRFPTPYTIAKIEGYLSDKESAPYEIPGGDYGTDLEVGDTIYYGGEEMQVLESNSTDFEAAESDKVHTFSLYDFTTDEWEQQREEVVGEFESIEEEYGKIETWEDAKKLIDSGKVNLHQLNYLSSEILTDIIDEEKEDIDFESLIDDKQDRFYEFFEFDEYMLDAEKVYYEEKGNDTQITYVESGAVIETFMQPDQYADRMETDPEDFNKNYESDEGLSSEAKTVLRFYDKQVIPYLKKTRKDLKEIKDRHGVGWYETKITAEDKQDVEAFQVQKRIQPISTKSALEQAQDFAIVRKTKLPIKAVDKIVENPQALGKYFQGTIEFIYNPDVTTMPHEIGHYWFDTMLTKDEQVEVLEEYKKWFANNRKGRAKPITMKSWEESMIQDMAEYYTKQYSGKKSRIQKFWDWFIYQIKQVLNQNDFIARFTYDVRTKSPDLETSKKMLRYNLQKAGQLPLEGRLEILPDETKGQAFRRKLQDLNTRLDTTVKALRKAGIYVPEEQDIFLAKTLLPRRIGGATEKFAKEVMNPIINAMARDGVELDNLNLYMHAVHAPERNKKMNQIRKEENDKRNLERVEPKEYIPVDGLSGMTNAEAKSVISTFKELGIAGKLEKYRKMLKDVSDATLDFQLEEGLLSKEEYDEIKGTYEYYVPLGRDIEDKAKGWGTGKGINIKGKEIKRARGSQDLPVLPIVAQIFNRMNVAIIRAEKNRVAQSVAKLIEANPNLKTKTGKDLWEVKSEKYIPQYDSFGELEYLEPLGMRSQKPNEIAFKDKGKQKYLVINDPLLVRALTDEGKSKPIPYLTQYTSLLSRLATQYNPEFVIRNFSRDVSEALINVQGIAENYLTKESAKGLEKDILSNIPKLFGEIYGYKSGMETHHARDLIQEFIDNGGEVGYFWLEDEKTIAKRFETQWRRAAPKGIADKTKNKISDFADFVGNVNSTVELVTRVSVYKAMRDRGISAKQSAEIAGDITVDFNKKGEWGSLISSMYMFFNAAVQGTGRLFRGIATSKKVRLMAGAMFIGGFLNGILSQLWGDADDKDYDKYIPDYKKNTRIVFADQSGKEWTVFFLPYGYGFFWAAGRRFSELATGQADFIETAGDISKSLVQSFSPIDITGGWTEAVPSSVKPLVEVATNEAWYDAPIAPEQLAYQPKIPESQRYFKTVSETAKSLTSWLNSVTGGDENRSGKIDISPEYLDYLWSQYTSGAGSFIGNIAETGYGIVTKEVKKENIPFVRSFVADIQKETQIKSSVYDMIDEGGRTEFNQPKKDLFYDQVDWLVEQGSLSEDVLENIKKGKELKLDFIKAQYNFTLTDKVSLSKALFEMSQEDRTEFYKSLTKTQIEKYLK